MNLYNVLKIATFEGSGFLGMSVCLFGPFLFQQQPPHPPRYPYPAFDLLHPEPKTSPLDRWILERYQKKGDPPWNGGRTKKKCSCIEMWGVFWIILE